MVMTVVPVLAGGGSAAALQVSLKIIESIWSQECFDSRVQDQKLQSQETALLMTARAIAREAFAWRLQGVRLGLV